MICPVTDEDLAEVRALLEQYRATSLSLLSNLEDHGTSLTEELDSGDFEEWESLMQAFATEEGMPLAGTSDQPQKPFEAQAAKGYVWGLLSDKLLLSTADYNARPVVSPVRVDPVDPIRRTSVIDRHGDALVSERLCCLFHEPGVLHGRRGDGNLVGPSAQEPVHVLQRPHPPSGGEGHEDIA